MKMNRIINHEHLGSSPFFANTLLGVVAGIDNQCIKINLVVSYNYRNFIVNLISYDKL